MNNAYARNEYDNDNEYARSTHKKPATIVTAFSSHKNESNPIGASVIWREEFH